MQPKKTEPKSYNLISDIVILVCVLILIGIFELLVNYNSSANDILDQTIKTILAFFFDPVSFVLIPISVPGGITIIIVLAVVGSIVISARYRNTKL